MRYLPIIISILLLLSCWDRKSVTSDETKTNFREFIDVIPNQALPLELSCGLPDRTNSSKEFKTFEKFIPKSTDRVFGTIKSNNKDYYLIIYGQTGDDVYPVLFSFNDRGKAIDSLRLILRACGGAGEDQIPHSFFSIDSDLTIVLTDTTRLIHYPGNFKSADDYIVDSLRVSRVVVRLDRNGRFVKQ